MREHKYCLCSHMRIPNAIKTVKKKNISNISCLIIFNTDFPTMAVFPLKVHYKATQDINKVCSSHNNETHMTPQRDTTPCLTSFHTCSGFQRKKPKSCFVSLYLKCTYIGIFIHNHSIKLNFYDNAAVNAIVLIIS